MKKLALLAAACLMHSALGSEQLLIEVKNLPQFGDAPVSWVVLRPQTDRLWVWSNDGELLLGEQALPQWDLNQKPASLPPQPKTSLTILSEQTVLGQNQLQRAWTQADFPPEATYYRLEKAISPHLLLRSPRYEIPKAQEIIQCLVPKQQYTKLHESRKIPLCFETIQSLPQEKNHWLIEVAWPNDTNPDSETRRFIRKTEKKMLLTFRKTPHWLVFKKSKDLTFSLKASRLHSEKLLQPKCQWQTLAAQEAALNTAQLAAPQELLKTTSPEGCELVYLANPADYVSRRKLDSTLLPTQMTVQFVKMESTETDKSVTIIKPRLFSPRTGLSEHLSQWLLQGGLTWRNLTSNRGEALSFLGGPSLESRFYASSSAYAAATLDYDWFKSSGNVKMTDFRASAHYAPSASVPLFLSLGYFSYALSGQNPGSLRLGAISGISIGTDYAYRSDPLVLEFQAQTLGNISNGALNVGYDFKLTASRFGTNNSQIELPASYWGAFLSLTQYSVTLPNLLNVNEAFSENRLQLGLVYGWSGRKAYIR